LQLAPELIKTDVADRTRQTGIGQHPVHVQVLDHDRLIFAAQPGSQLVHEVGTHAGDALVQPGQRAGATRPVLRFRQPYAFRDRSHDADSFPGRFQLARLAPRADAQAPQCCRERARCRDLLAVRQSSGRAHAQVDAGNAVTRTVQARNAIRHLDLHRQIPAVGLASDARSHDPAGPAQMLA